MPFDTSFLQNKHTRILSVVLLLQAGAFYGFSRTEVIPENIPLAEAPKQFGSWQMTSEGVIEKEILDVLKADEVLNRFYRSSEARLPAGLFVAYFRSQRTGRAPHSPKNCLPGSGWVPSSQDSLSIPLDGRAPIEVNRYVIAKGDEKSVVLYWYQSRDRVVADEYTAKFYVVADALRHNRTDTALVRVTVPVAGNDVESSEKAAVDFVKAMFTPLRRHFPA